MRTRILLMGLLLAAVANAQAIYHDASAFYGAQNETYIED